MANIYLHEVLDVWFHAKVKPRLRGEALLIRYADDFVIVCAEETDAGRILAGLPKIFGKYNLTLHPDKTRKVPFREPPYRRPGSRPPVGAGPETFDLLGFTHYWGRTRTGGWAIMWKTATSRFTRALKRASECIRLNRYRPVTEQHKTLVQKLRGHFNYYGVTCNMLALKRFVFEVALWWKKWLGRRSQRTALSQGRFTAFMVRFPLPAPRLVRSVCRSAANPLCEVPDAGNLHVRICGGGRGGNSPVYPTPDEPSSAFSMCIHTSTINSGPPIWC